MAVDATVASGGVVGTETVTETGRRLKRVSKTSKSSSSSSSTSSSSTSSSSSSSNHEEDSDIPVKSDRAQSISESDHPRDTSAAAIMCAALLELGKILEPMNSQLQSLESRRRNLELSTKNKLDSSVSKQLGLGLGLGPSTDKTLASMNKPLAPSVTGSSSPSLRHRSQEYISYALAQLHSLSSPTYRTLPSSSRQLIRVSKTHPSNTPSTDTINTMATTTNVTIQNNKDGCYFLCEEFFLLKHGTGHFPHHR